MIICPRLGATNTTTNPNTFQAPANRRHGSRAGQRHINCLQLGGTELNRSARHSSQNATARPAPSSPTASVEKPPFSFSPPVLETEYTHHASSATTSCQLLDYLPPFACLLLSALRFPCWASTAHVKLSSKNNELDAKPPLLLLLALPPSYPSPSPFPCPSAPPSLPTPTNTSQVRLDCSIAGRLKRLHVNSYP